MKQLSKCFLLLVLVFSVPSLAQKTRTVVRGMVVSSEESLSIEGVAVYIKGGRNCTGTLYDGTYALEINTGDSVIVFAHDDYETTEYTIGKNITEYNVVMKRKP